MILNVEGNINRYYVQTLCMVFFPGATFGENELPGMGVPEVNVNVYNDEEGDVTAFVSMKLNDRTCEATETVRKDEDISVAEHSAIAVGRAVFAAGKELLGHIPPWGILTGVRPAKIASSILAEGRGVLKTKKILRDEYFLNHQKAALAVSVATAEAKLLKKIEDNTCSLYVSIPFCPTRCSYCSFVSYTTPRLLSMIDDYLDALLYELDETFEVISAVGLKVNTVYIGGGTPTTLNAQQLRKLLTKINEKLDVSSLLEFTLEAGRPDTITKDKLDVAKELGVTRISVNPQTLNDDILREIGRNHTRDDFFEAYRIAKESGIKDIIIVLKSILFLLVLITFITTPTRAYEAYNNIGSLLVLEQDSTLKVKKSNIVSSSSTTTNTKNVVSDVALTNETHNLCLIAINDVEKNYNIKKDLLQTIASVESGRYISKVGKRLPWPWTVQSNGKGKYYKTKEEAINAVKQMQSQGIQNIDVGCMQINLKYHGQSFKNIEEAFEPQNNVAYSATFLQKLNKKNNNWQKTAMQYHSKNISRGTNYKNKLVKHYAQYIRTDIQSQLF